MVDHYIKKHCINPLFQLKSEILIFDVICGAILTSFPEIIGKNPFFFTTDILFYYQNFYLNRHGDQNLWMCRNIPSISSNEKKKLQHFENHGCLVGTLFFRLSQLQSFPTWYPLKIFERGFNQHVRNLFDENYIKYISHCTFLKCH